MSTSVTHPGGTVTTGHPLRLYNSLGRRLEHFTPTGDEVGMYSCGPTVYAYPHLGNMRAYVFADTLRRALRWKGISVRHVVNITDVGHTVADTETGGGQARGRGGQGAALGHGHRRLLHRRLLRRQR